MNYVMHRSFADAMGMVWPKDLAFIENWKRVTYSQLKAERVQRQRRHLDKVKASSGPVRHAAFLWVFYQPGIFGFAFMGYWLAIRTLKHDWTFSFRAFENGLKALDIMRQFPCGVIPLPENFERWKEAFIAQHRRPGRFKKQGLLMGWVECEYEGGWPKKFVSGGVPSEGHKEK